MAMLKLATLINNPGEPEVDSRYSDPKLLRDLGYNGLVVYETTALSGVESPDTIESGEVRRWVQHHIDHAARIFDAAHDAGLDVFFFYDALVLPRPLVDRNATVMTCKNRPLTLCPASEQAWERSARALEMTLRRFPQIEGVVLRLGDTDASRLPHLVGNEIYTPHCARCSQFGRADRLIAGLERFHELVVNRHDKRLIARAWNVRPNGLHDSVELAQRVIDRLPGDADDDRFMLSFKFTQADFWRYQKWNPSSLLMGKRPVIYELQCQREFEGKGGFPNWQASLWRDGMPEMRGRDEVGGLAQVSERVNLAGLWGWVRGGGWGGPFIKDETWIDANVFAVPRLADNPRVDVSKLADEWITHALGIKKGKTRQRLAQVLLHSADAVRDAFYIGPYALQKSDPWHPNADWIQDDLVDAEAVWRIIQRLPMDKLDDVVREKQAAADRLSRDRHDLHRLLEDKGTSKLDPRTLSPRNPAKLDPLVASLMYAESLFEALRDLVAGLVAYRRFKKSGDRADGDAARRSLYHAQSHWNHHVQRVGSLPGVATPFRESGFWDLTQRILDELG